VSLSHGRHCCVSVLSVMCQTPSRVRHCHMSRHWHVSPLYTCLCLPSLTLVC